MLLFNAFGRCFKYSKEITDITTNDPKDESLACVSQFVGIYEDLSKLDRPFLPKVRSAYNFSMATTVKFNRAIGIIKKSTSNTVN
ncbi:hypothetical protein [Microcoleus sp. B9-D4]|uniref:hypothetical protein n=1 Tax=Microcoleus sp. B9-D4 TaxID=2818711 RepID=UPI002FD1E0E8